MPSKLQQHIHALEAEEEVGVEVRRDVAVMWLKVLMLVATKKPRDPLRRAEIIAVERSDVLQSGQFVAPDCLHIWLARSPGEWVPVWVATRSRRRSLSDGRVLLRDLGGRPIRGRCRCRRFLWRRSWRRFSNLEHQEDPCTASPKTQS